MDSCFALLVLGARQHGAYKNKKPGACAYKCNGDSCLFKIYIYLRFDKDFS